MGSKNRVIVIGSGVSGLACARELVQRGYDVLVVEARSRVGGRLKGEALQLQSNGKPHSQPVDLGGALIHGIDENPIHKITTQMGIPLHEISDYCLLLNENGWPFDPKEDEKISTLFNECLDETFRQIELDKKASRTFGDLFDEVCREKGVLPSNPLLKWHQANLELPTGADFHELGYTWNDDEPYGFTGAHAAVGTSWKLVVDHLADGLQILYNSPISRIQVVQPDGTTPNTYPRPPEKPIKSETKVEPEAPPIKVITRTEWRSAPKPAVVSPTRRSRRIRGEDVNLRRSGRSNKGIIQKLQIGHESSICYDDPTKTNQTPDSKRRRKNHESENTPPTSKVQVTLANGTVLEANAVVCTLPLGVLQIPTGMPGHIDFQPPLPTVKRNAIDQLGCGLLNKCAISFPSVFWQDSEFLGMAAKEHSYLVLNATKYTDEPILIFMYGGSFAREIESWTDAEVVEDCLSVLRQICVKDVPPPIDYCVTRWGKEVFSRMAFTYIPPGVDGHQCLTDAGEALYDPVNPEKPLIMFAGEHTTPYHPSTMHGAFLSGIREAYRYDIFMSPELNDHMEFDTDHKIYERTFPVRKVYNGPIPEATATTTTPAPKTVSQVRSRRNRFAGMALRKLPSTMDSLATSSPMNNSNAKKNKAPAPMTPDKVVSRRRSQRSSSSKSMMLDVLATAGSPPDKQTSSVEWTKQQKKVLDALEDRILLRSLHSYGRDFGLIRSKIVPVFGSNRRRTSDQIKQRWQQLAGRRRRSEIWKSWQAAKVAKIPPKTMIQRKRKAPTPVAPKQDARDLRRSHRQRSPKQWTSC